MAVTREPTVVEYLLLVQGKVKRLLENSAFPDAKRNYALANTALEDAMMRYTRARATEEDVLVQGDLDNQTWLERAQEATAERRAHMQSRYHEPPT